MEKKSNRFGNGLHFLKTKVVVGYLLISLVAVISMFFIVNNMRSLSPFDTSGEVTKEKMYALNEMYYNLYTSECLIGEALVLPSKYKDYVLISDSIRKQIEELKELFAEQEQIELLDTLSLLLDQKRNNVQSLVLLSANSSIDELYRQHFLKTIEENDSLLCNRVVEQTVTVVSDTITYQRPSQKKKSFFRRIFSSSEPEDTVVEVRSMEYSVTDSLLSSYNPADTINKIFESLKSQVREKKLNIDKSMMDNMVEIQKTNKVINVKMNKIIHQLQEEDWNNALSAFDGREASLGKVMSYLRNFIVVAVFLLFILVMMVWRDINIYKKYNNQLRLANQRTLNLMDSREKMMLSVAHDIKAPLGSIIGYIELLDNNKLNVKQSYYLDNMKSSSEHILHLVTDILDFNRLDAGGVELNPLPFNSRSLFEDVVATFRPQAEKKNLRLEFKFTSDSERTMLVGDPLRIRQIVHNLISNAVKFTQIGKVSLAVSLTKVDEKNCSLSIVVSDTGVGISPENQKTIFKEYVRVETDSSVPVEGFGLGLSILRKLVDIHKGTISLESEFGKGSTFKVTLPLSYSDEQAMPKSNFQERKDSPRVLVIDDDPSQLTMISEQLKSRGLTCTACEDPYSALDVIEKNTFDIILSDIQMPGFNGFEIVKRVRSGNFPNAKTIPVIALSARADISLSKFRKHGFTSFLNKPFTCDQLIGEIAKHLDLSESCVSSNSSRTVIPSSSGFKNILAYAGGDVKAEFEILSSFLTETQKNVVELERLQTSGEVHTAGRLAHKMLAIFKLVADASLVEWLTELEKEKSGVLADRKRFDENRRKIDLLVKEGMKELARIRKML